MGDIYSGYGFSKTLIGSCENGAIYRGFGLGREQIGSYDDRCIFRGFGLGATVVGYYQDGTIYSTAGFSDTVGSYDSDGSIYYGRRLTRQLAGSSTGGGAEAGALLLLMSDTLPSFVLDDKQPTYEPGNQSHNHTRPTGTTYTMHFYDEADVVVLIILALLIVMFIAGCFLLWPIAFKSVEKEPEAWLYIVLTILSIAIGMLGSFVLFKKNKTYKNFYISTWIISAILVDIEGAVLDSNNVSILALVFALPLATAMMTAIPSVVVWNIHKAIKKGKNRL
jgi:hypothetical protein